MPRTKPCPFCGREPRLISGKRVGGACFAWSCGCDVMRPTRDHKLCLMYAKLDDAVYAWNARPAEVEALTWGDSLAVLLESIAYHIQRGGPESEVHIKNLVSNVPPRPDMGAGAP